MPTTLINITKEAFPCSRKWHRRLVISGWLRAESTWRLPSQEPTKVCRCRANSLVDLFGGPVVTERAINFIVKEAAERAGVNPAASIHCYGTRTLPKIGRAHV